MTITSIEIIKVIGGHVVPQTTYDFQIINRCNYTTISHRFRNTTTYRPKNRDIFIAPHLRFPFRVWF